MINVGKCPKCERTVINVKMENVRIDVGFTPAYEGVSYICPSCNSVLGIQMDPIALNSDLVDEIIEKLKE
jgi:hypothetical protein